MTIHFKEKDGLYAYMFSNIDGTYKAERKKEFPWEEWFKYDAELQKKVVTKLEPGFCHKKKRHGMRLIWNVESTSNIITWISIYPLVLPNRIN